MLSNLHARTLELCRSDVQWHVRSRLHQSNQELGAPTYILAVKHGSVAHAIGKDGNAISSTNMVASSNQAW